MPSMPPRRGHRHLMERRVGVRGHGMGGDVRVRSEGWGWGWHDMQHFSLAGRTGATTAAIILPPSRASGGVVSVWAVDLVRLDS